MMSDTAKSMRSNHDRWRAAPVVTVEALTLDGPILILAPHPDDESIGCGGLIQQAVRRPVPVFVDVLTDGSRSHPGSKSHPAAVLATLRRREARAACAGLGVAPHRIDFWNEIDGALGEEGQRAEVLVARLEARIATIDPGAVFVTWIDDPHCDHQAAFRIAAEAVRRSTRRPRLLAYPVWSWTVVRPRHDLEGDVFRLDIAADLARKRAAVACHASQLGTVISDDPGGFTLSPQNLELFTQPFETFIEVGL